MKALEQSLKGKVKKVTNLNTLGLTMSRGRLILMKFLLVTLALIAILVLAKGASSKRNK
jgi:hypothetical protein